MKKYLIELGWLTGIGFISYVLSIMLVGIFFTIDINFHDTYFVVDFKYFYLLFFIFLVAIVYFVRGVVARFGHLLVNVVLLISNLLAMVFIAALTFSIFKIGGQTVYPPLSQLPETTPTEELGVFFYLMLLLSISLLALNVFVCYRTYRLLKTAQTA